ncbi:MAG: hypothetical protein H6622_14975 [Halobacteriovoraceae bacterium]|nr:hypothetical protein [Halobacteriovoraceae bacterium]
MKNYLNHFTIFIILLTSCSMPKVKQRGIGGLPPQEAVNETFSGVKKKVSILPFFNEAPYGGDDLALTASSELQNELFRTGEFIFDPVDQNMFGTSKEIYSGGGVKLVQLSRRAKVAGINFVIYGRIIEARVREKTDEIGLVRKTKSYSESQVEIRIFDVNSNKEIYTDVLRGLADESSYKFFKTAREDQLLNRRNLMRYSVRIAVRRSIPKLLSLSKKLEWIGRVAKIVGNKIYINAGRKSGIQVSDILKVITEGQDIFDPETGALIGVSRGEIKGTVEVIDYVGIDGAVAILHSGGSVLEGDYVMLY